MASHLPGPTLIAAIITMVSMPASLLGNECALRFGSRPALSAIMAISGLLGIFFGFTAALPIYAMLAYGLIYYMFVSADSGALTSGMMAVSKPDQRGATMALHSIAGFGGSMLGPLMAGFALDAAQAGFGASSLWAWGLGLSVMGFGALIGPVALYWAGARGASAAR
jgi:MFS family permease